MDSRFWKIINNLFISLPIIVSPVVFLLSRIKSNSSRVFQQHIWSGFPCQCQSSAGHSVSWRTETCLGAPGGEGKPQSSITYRNSTGSHRVAADQSCEYSDLSYLWAWVYVMCEWGDFWTVFQFRFRQCKIVSAWFIFCPLGHFWQFLVLIFVAIHE